MSKYIRNLILLTVAFLASLSIFAYDFSGHTPTSDDSLTGVDATLTGVLIKNAQIFDGKNETLLTGMDVLVEDNLIKKISKNIEATSGIKVIDAKGRTLMPGMIDAHWHTMLAGITLQELLSEFDGYLNIVAAVEAKNTLLRGFTTVRDVGGNSFSLKKTIDRGLITGPRIYPSGMAIGQTSGHSDTRPYTAVPSNSCTHLDKLAADGHFIVADGVPEVLKRTREALRMGASQIKVMAGGGTTSQYDPIDSHQYTFEELRAAVEAAEHWNTYVGVHVYTPRSIKMAIEAGVKVMEHAHLIDEEAMKLAKKNDVWINLQPFVVDPDQVPLSEDPATRKKQLEMLEGTDQAYKLAKKYKVNLAWGTDIITNPEAAKVQGQYVVNLLEWFTPYEALRMVTYDNGRLTKLSGPRNPYQEGELGIIKEGAYADILLIDGNPLEDLELVANPDNLVVIIKDGKIYKNTIK